MEKKIKNSQKIKLDKKSIYFKKININVFKERKKRTRRVSNVFD